MIVPLEVYLSYVATVLVFFAHPPGPGQLLFMAHAMKRGIRGALPVILGNHAANIIQMMLAGFGLAGALAASASLFLVAKWLGVAYLAWLGIVMVRRGAAGGLLGGVDRRSSLVRQGFITAAANPFAIMFFAALFPQFLNVDLPLLPQIVVLGATYLAIDGVVLLALGTSASRLLSLLGERAAAAVLMNRVAGSLMITAALLLALRGIEPGSDR